MQLIEGHLYGHTSTEVEKKDLNPRPHEYFPHEVLALPSFYNRGLNFTSYLLHNTKRIRRELLGIDRFFKLLVFGRLKGQPTQRPANTQYAALYY